MTELLSNGMLVKNQTITHGSRNVSWLTPRGKGQFYFDVLLRFNLDLDPELVGTFLYHQCIKLSVYIIQYVTITLGTM